MNQSGCNNSFYGKHHTEDVKKHLSNVKTKYDATYIDKLRELRNQGMTIKKIAEMFKINEHVAGDLIKYGTSSRRKINQYKKIKCND